MGFEPAVTFDLALQTHLQMLALAEGFYLHPKVISDLITRWRGNNSVAKIIHQLQFKVMSLDMTSTSSSPKKVNQTLSDFDDIFQQSGGGNCPAVEPFYLEEKEEVQEKEQRLEDDTGLVSTSSSRVAEMIRLSQRCEDRVSHVWPLEGITCQEDEGGSTALQQRENQSVEKE